MITFFYHETKEKFGFCSKSLASSTWKVLKDIDFQKPCEGILVLLDSRSKLW